MAEQDQDGFMDPIEDSSTEITYVDQDSSSIPSAAVSGRRRPSFARKTLKKMEDKHAKTPKKSKHCESCNNTLPDTWQLNLCLGCDKNKRVRLGGIVKGDFDYEATIDITSDPETGEEPDSSQDSMAEGGSEREQEQAHTLLEDIELLLQDIYETWDIQQEEMPLFQQDEFWAGASPTQRGYFWHLTDLHLDPNYTVTTDPTNVCPSAGDQPVTDPGKWGNYLCDSPRTLINSSIYAMKTILPDPDFILWTGDDTPHVPNEQLSEKAVLDIVEWLTNLIMEVFPTTKVYAALGNHDFHPKNQLPAQSNVIYDRISEFWKPWLKAESISTFQKGAYYSEPLVNTGVASRVLILNTNLYYDSNSITANMMDPSEQFSWLENQLIDASQNGEKVYIVGHVPPGYFEKKREKAWFRENFNKRYIEIIQKYFTVIQGQFFGHHHTDSYRMFYNNAGDPISTIFIAPGVTPWKTTLPGVENGANNPGIRVFEYDRNTLHILDMITYYMNLTFANKESPRWEKEYRLTEAFLVPDGSPQSMHTMLQKISNEPCFLQKYYEYNSVNYDLDICDGSCKMDHVCAIREVDFTNYSACLRSESSISTPIYHTMVLLTVLLTYVLNFK
ncbi:acid sphingomyelinase-like phosphodiesterase 3b [Gastrophryne carolinensis]